MRLPTHIVIGGLAGTGKSTLARRLAEYYSVQRFSAGSVMRSLARERGVDLSVLEEEAEADPNLDAEVFDRVYNFARTRIGWVIDGWFVWNLAGDAMFQTGTAPTTTTTSSTRRVSRKNLFFAGLSSSCLPAPVFREVGFSLIEYRYMQKSSFWKMIFLSFFILVFTIVVWNFSRRPSDFETSVIAAQQTIREAGACTQDADCEVVAGDSCTFGCYVAVNKKEVSRMQELIDTLASQEPSTCHLDCAAPESPKCVANQCTIGE